MTRPSQNPSRPRKRVRVYIDGLNFYHRKVKDTLYKWLDFKRMCELLLPADMEIVKIIYCTSEVSNLPNDPQAQDRQKLYLRALRAYIPEVDIIYGKIRKRDKTGPLAAKDAGQPEGIAQAEKLEFATISTFEEKGSDVNLAVQLVHDAHMDEFDAAVVISNDSDLARALEIVKTKCRKEVWLLSPLGKGDRAMKELRRHSTHRLPIPDDILPQCQLPDPIPRTSIHKPKAWKHRKPRKQKNS